MCEILPATPDDLAEIVRIEEACFSAPWTRKMLEAELNGNQFAHFLVARQELVPGSERAPLVGYLCYWIVFEELRFMNLAVIESMRRRGIARCLVARALHAGVTQSAVRAVLEVRSSNQAAQCLYQSFGFQQAGLRPQYYNRPVEDAVLMELEPMTPQPASGSHTDG
jgi:ribosomal-protein-alanine N-acetyltransferase